LSGHILICPDLEYLERASDDAKYGQPSQRPYLDIVIPSLLDSSLAPPGHHLMCINVQYAPYFLREGDWDSLREPLGDRVLACLEEYFPGLGEKVLARQVLTPIDLERQFGLTGGDIYQGEMGLDQLLFMRPIPGYAGYRTPVDNLYLCGAGAHPGGGVTGAPGYNASRAVIKDLRR
jgi:phytoene dehydrogenase-like protein